MSRRGFILIELFCVLGLLSVAGLLAARLLSLSIHSTHDAVEMQDQISRYASVLFTLRSDALHADRAATLEGNVLQIGAVQWIAATNSVSRQDGEGVRKWSGVDVGIKPSPVGIDVWPAGEPQRATSLPIPQQWLVTVKS